MSISADRNIAALKEFEMLSKYKDGEVDIGTLKQIKSKRKNRHKYLLEHGDCLKRKVVNFFNSIPGQLIICKLQKISLTSTLRIKEILDILN